MQKENKEDSMSNYSEEVQAIIDRMPTQWVKWFSLCASMVAMELQSQLNNP